MTTPFKALLRGTQIAATASLLATTAMAQTTTIDTPQGNSVIVPDDALEEQPSGGFIRESDYPRFESIENYQAIADTLTNQGYSDVFIQRDGPILTVTAQRAGVPIELVYSTANARLVSVDGVETRAEPEGSSAGDLAGAPTGSGTTPGEDATAPGEDAAGDGTEGGTDTPGDTPSDGSADGSGDTPDGSEDSGSDDGGAEGAGTDGGSDGGEADGGSDGAGSNGGESDGGGSDGGESGGESGGDSDGGGSEGGDSGGGDSGGGDSDGGEGDSNG
ncbi:hypothetical protein E4191_01645 [Paracoccus liaowanqingii]|uniref:Uncharacterized protein n=1 Tax=Paracoccus liaowanqingii TaxID=2560053 RepID=A0A4P7HHQ2_9RHOB|nr:hypothetical protein [Paracoccus liaowanqingii]QBX33566.1 hypothetical protein E4191_01645 [Paracoccus liaowanqingii]